MCGYDCSKPVSIEITGYSLLGFNSTESCATLSMILDQDFADLFSAVT